MNKPSAAAAPETGIPRFADLLADPEIAALLDFEPAVRKTKRRDGWSPGLQRELIARIAHCGSPGAAADQMDKNPTGAKLLYRADGADSFRVAWNSALALAEERERARREFGPGRPIAVPGMPNRPVGPQARDRFPEMEPLLPGQVINEYGQPEDEQSYNRRGEEAKDSIGSKLLRCRRAFLREISRSPGKRAAFEILTELSIDWDKAAALEPQDDEPWASPNMREPDMVLTAENGWLGSFVPYGPDKIGALREAVNRHRAEQGLPPIMDWSDDEPDTDDCDGDGYVDPDEDADSVLHAWAAEHGEPAPGGPPPIRSFGLNSQEFYDAVAKPGRRAKVPTRSTEPKSNDGAADASA